MPGTGRPGNADKNGRFWGVRASDWASLQEGQFSVAYERVFDRLGVSSDTVYCDVGCGSGMAALIASLRSARVFGLDASEALLEIARERVPSGEFHQGVMEALPFPDDIFDLVTGFNSFQYAADPVAALSQAKRVTKPGGRIVVMTWGDPDGMEAATLVEALTPLLPPPPPGAPGPFALSDETALRAFVEKADLEPLQIEDVDCNWAYPDLSTALRGLGSSGVAVRAIENTSEEAVNQAHAEALASFRRDDGSYRIGASFRWLVAGV